MPERPKCEDIHTAENSTAAFVKSLTELLKRRSIDVIELVGLLSM
jgi:hypothetical protein